MRKTILIFGVSSFVGSSFFEALQDEYRVIGTYYETPVNIPGILTLRCDVLKKDFVNNLIGLIKPDVTIYAAGMSSLTECHFNPKRADALNTVGMINCCSSAERFGSKFVYISSSYVLGGENTVYRESDTPLPVTVYGNTQASGEFYIQKSCLNYIIFRCCPVYGRGFHPERLNWFEVIERNLSKGIGFVADDNIFTGFLDISVLARVLKLALKENITNRLFQVSTRDVMSRYGVAETYCKIFGGDMNLITRGTWDFPVDENQYRNKAVTRLTFRMDTFNLEDHFGLVLPSIEESLLLTKKRLAG